MTTIQRLSQHVQKILDGEHHVRPGTPARFTAACQAGDCIDQGDLRIILIDDIPTHYKKVTQKQKQLVPGNTEGARHCLDSLAGVQMYLPKDWPNENGLEGPIFVLTKERTILHPTHGPVTIPAGFTVQCRYQREWLKEEERRVRD